MSDNDQHAYLGKLHEQLESRKIDRREFLRTATLLGLSATAAYAAAVRILGGDAGGQALAQATTNPKGGDLPVSLTRPAISTPHPYSSAESTNSDHPATA